MSMEGGGDQDGIFTVFSNSIAQTSLFIFISLVLIHFICWYMIMLISPPKKEKFTIDDNIEENNSIDLKD